MAYTCVNTSASDGSRLAGTRYIYGFKVNLFNISGTKPIGFKFNIKSDSDAGTLTCKLYDSSTALPTALHTYATVNLSAIGSSYTTIEFAGTAYADALSNGQLIGLEYSSTSSVPDIYIQVLNTSDAEGVYWEYNGTTYEEVSNRSPYYCYDLGSTPSSDVLLNPPQVAYI
jgi:hypothetical protein